VHVRRIASQQDTSSVRRGLPGRVGKSEMKVIVHP
jgi:hypothetical protein